MTRKKKTVFIRALVAVLAIQCAFSLYTGTPGTKSVASAANAEEKQSSQAGLRALTVNKARYTPGEEVTFNFKFRDNEDWSGELNVEIYRLNTLVAKGTKSVAVMKGKGNLEAKWTPPKDDFTGYMVKAWMSGSATNDYVTAAIDVSSDWTHFPRYGYVTEFPKETAEQSGAKLKQLSQEYYLNGYQFYDWMWRHDVSVYSQTDENGKPLMDEQGNFITGDISADSHYTDLLGRTLYPLSVKQQVAAAQKYGSAAMAYQMNYAARENYEDFGVNPAWGLYNTDKLDPANPQKDQVGYTFNVNGKTTSLFLQDPGNKDWQHYINKQFDRSINVFGFNGIHLDQWGANDNSFLYDYNGKKRYYSLDYDELINSVKNSLQANNPDKSNVTFNMVGGNAEYSAVPSPGTKTDFDYSEIWQDRNHYQDVQKVVEDTREKNGGKAMVIAGYMNYRQATGVTTNGTKAEDVPSTVDYQSRISKAYGWVGNFGRKDTDAVTFTVDAPAAGDYKLVLNYGHGNGSGHPEGKLTLNGEVVQSSIPFDTNTGWGYPIAQYTVSAALKQGENKVKLTLNTNNLWLNLASLDVQEEGLSERYEAVDAELDTVIVDQYSHVYYFDTKDDYMTFHVVAPEEGDYPLGFSYASDWQAVNRDIIVNKDKQGEVVFPGLGSWDKFTRQDQMAQVHLKAGDNTITLKAPTDDLGIKLQYMTVGSKKYYAFYSDIPQTNSITYNESKTDNFGQQGQTVTYNVYADHALNEITVLYHGDNDPVMSVLVDGEAASSANKVNFPKTPGGWGGSMQPKVLPVDISEGHHKITVVMESNGQYINLGGLLVGGYEYSTGSAEVTGGVIPVIGYAANFKQANDRIVFHVQAPAAGSYDLGWIYRNKAPGATTVTRSVYVGDGDGIPVSLAPTSESEWGAEILQGIHLKEGSNQITIKMTEGSDSGIELDQLTVVPSDQPGAVTRSYEAESTQPKETFSLYKDTVIHFGEIGQQVTYPVSVPQAGEQSLIFTYSNPGGPTTRSVYIDGERAKNENGHDLKIVFDGTGDINTYSGDGYVIIPHMTAGDHKVTLKMEQDDAPGTIQLRGVTVGYFNEPSVRLMDAALAMMGATHIEIGTAEKFEEGPNMLAHEYYPNRSKKMMDSTKEAMKNYYKFFAAYENLLFDSKTDKDAVVRVTNAEGQDVALSHNGQENTLWYTVRKNSENRRFASYDVIHLLNLINNDSNWRNAAHEPIQQHHLQVDYPVGVQRDKAPKLKVYAATPDQGGGVMQELSYKWNGDHILIDVPNLEYWTMLVVDREPKQGDVEKLFPKGSPLPNPSPTPSPSPSPLPTPTPSPGQKTKVISEQELKDGHNGQVKIALYNEIMNVHIPLNAGELLGNNDLVLNFGGLSLRWTASALKELGNKGTDQAGAYLDLAWNRTKDPSQLSLQLPSGLKLTQDLYALNLSVKNKEGKIIDAISWNPQTGIELAISDPKLKGKLLGLYAYNKETAQWNYVGGRYQRASKLFKASLTGSGTFAVFEYDKSYTDVPNSHWAYEAIAALSSKHVVTGMGNDKFLPQGTATRAQFTAMLVRALNVQESGDTADFTDIPANAWYAKEVTSAYAAGLVQGKSDGKFDPNGSVTRQEMAVMLQRAYLYAGGKAAVGSPLGYTDASSIADWAKEAVMQASASGLLRGNENGSFAPAGITTRAEIAQGIDRLLDMIEQ